MKITTGLLLVSLFIVGCQKSMQDVVLLKNNIQKVDNLNLSQSKFVVPEVVIGNQIWMSRNLDVSKYRNGDIIPQVKDAQKWDTLTTGAWCYYDNSTPLGKVYGKLYNWAAVNDPRGLAPKGWHVSSGADWAKMSEYLGGGSATVIAIKEAGHQHWIASMDPNQMEATNSTGFTALPGGFRFLDNDRSFWELGQTGNWWTTDAISGVDYSWMQIRYDFPVFQAWEAHVETINRTGFSVRCVKD